MFFGVQEGVEQFDVDRAISTSMGWKKDSAFARELFQANSLESPPFLFEKKELFLSRLAAIAEKRMILLLPLNVENANNNPASTFLTGRLRPCPCPDERSHAEEHGQDDPEVEPRGLIAWQVRRLGRIRVLRPERDPEKGGRHGCRQSFLSFYLSKKCFLLPSLSLPSLLPLSLSPRAASFSSSSGKRKIYTEQDLLPRGKDKVRK